jgi:hypothetical protein
MEERALKAYKFLKPGAVGPFSGIEWPRPVNGDPGSWIERDDGVSACGSRHLPMWICAELWEVDLDGDVRAVGHKLIAPRARLARRVEAWSPELLGRFAEHCARRAAEHAADPPADVAQAVEAMLADANTCAQGATMSDDPAMVAQATIGAAYIAAMIARRVDGPDAFDAERAHQADWLEDALKLV